MKAFSFLILCLLFFACRPTPPKTEEMQETQLDVQKGISILVEPDAGKTWNVFGLEIVGKIMSQQTNGQYSVIMSKTPPNGGPPPHVHQKEDELFYVLQGKYRFICGTDSMQATQGSLVHLPRGIPHSFQNIGEIEGILLNTITPGGFEQFFEEIDQLPKNQPPDRKLVEEIAAKYELKFLPPPSAD